MIDNKKSKNLKDLSMRYHAACVKGILRSGVREDVGYSDASVSKNIKEVK